MSPSPTGELIRRLAPLLGLAALGLLAAAGGPLSRGELPFWVGAALLYGVLAWLLLGRYADEGEVPGPVEPGGPPPRLLPLAVVVPFALLAWKHTSGNRFDLPGVIAWVGAVAAWAWAWRPGSRLPVPGFRPPPSFPPPGGGRGGRQLGTGNCELETWVCAPSTFRLK